MVRNLLVYGAVCLILVAVVRVAGRLIGLDRPSSGPTGQAWLDAEAVFDRVRRQHRRHHVVAVLGGQPHRLDLPMMNQTTILGGLPGATEFQIPIRDIVGTAGAADGRFDRDFLLVGRQVPIIDTAEPLDRERRLASASDVNPGFTERPSTP